MLLSPGWTLIGSELFSPTFDSSDRAEQLFPIRYPNEVIKSLCDSLVICLNYHANAYFRSFARFRSQTMTESERCLFELRFSVTLLNSFHFLADFATKILSTCKKTVHANTPIVCSLCGPGLVLGHCGVF